MTYYGAGIIMFTDVKNAYTVYKRNYINAF